MYQAKKIKDWDKFNNPIEQVEKSRICYHVSTIDLKSEKISPSLGKPTLVGFCSDEGVRRNNGRLGAKEGPDAIRLALAKMPWHGKKDFLSDVGNEICNGKELEKAQNEYAQIIGRLLLKKRFPIGIGGGHEIAIGGYMGVRSIYKDQKLGIINFDAHFDLRSTDGQSPNSGTSFFQMAEHSQQNRMAFNYLCLGIQDISNTPLLFKTAKSFEVDWRTSEEMHEQSAQHLNNSIDTFLDEMDIVYVSICMDVFHENFAPGVSAPNSLGLEPKIVSEMLVHILGSGKVVYLDLAETSPALDIDGRTVRLAATFIYQILKKVT